MAGLTVGLKELRSEMEAAELRLHGRLSNVHPAFEASARNLLHYVVLRQRDIREIQTGLAALGLSSLGRCESHVMQNLDAVLAALGTLAGSRPAAENSYRPPVDRREGEELLARHTEALLGTRPRRQAVRVMVTLPSEAAGDPALVRELIKVGMDCARINCAHDGPPAWESMAAHVRAASRETGRPCRILMDLAGPKLRTGQLEPGPEVVRWRPERDLLGNVVRPAIVWLTDASRPSPPPEPAAVVPVAGRGFLRNLAVGAQIGFEDSRGRGRQLHVIGPAPGGVLASADRTAYLTPGIRLEVAGGPAGKVGRLPPVERPIVLAPGDRLVLTASQQPGRNAVPPGPDGTGGEPARIPCSLPGVLADLKPNERIWLDDGAIGGVIERASADEAHVRIVHARARGSRLRSEKGINLPDSALSVKGLTADDIECLPLVAARADMVALSFLRGPDDVAALQRELHRLRANHLGVVLKIETRRALEQMPAVLLAAMRSYTVGVMIARGDLAVELGYERLAEAQEELLWLCEAAHVPVIWATQVLESLSKQGQPSRAEITDAAMGVRAECVMLNKGPYVLETVRMLQEILRRMESHQTKKTSLLGRLNISWRDL